MWVAADEASRTTAARVRLEAGPNELMLVAVQQAKGATAKWFVALAGLLKAAGDGDRWNFAEGLLGLTPAPSWLQNIVQQQLQGSSWHDVTGEENVRWGVHPGQGAWPAYDPAIVQGGTWSFTTLTIYGTVIVKIMMQACEERFAGLENRDRTLAFEAVCLHFNTAVAAIPLPMRLMLTTTRGRPWKYEMNPYSSAAQYGGKKRRLTATQQQTGETEGRAKRVIEGPK